MREMNEAEELVLIDDDPVINMIHAKLLEKAFPAKKVVAFTNPEEGIAYAKLRLAKSGWRPYILLDINMPEMSGWEFIEELESMQNGKELPVAIVTSSIDQQDKVKAAQYPMVRSFFVKPFNPNKLSKGENNSQSNEAE